MGRARKHAHARTAQVAAVESEHAGRTTETADKMILAVRAAVVVWELVREIAEIVSGGGPGRGR